MKSILRIAISAIVAIMAIDEQARAQVGAAAMEEGIISAQLYQVSRRDIVASFAGDTLFLPYRSIAEFLGIIHGVSADGDTLSGELPTGAPFAFIVSSGTFQRNGEIDTLRAGALVRGVDDILIRADELSRTLRLNAEYNHEQLTLTIPPDRSIPAVDARAALRRYARLGDGGVLVDEARGELVSLTRSVLGPIALDWGLSNMTMGEQTSSSGNVALSTPFLYGVLGLRGRAGLTNGDGARLDLGFEAATWRLDLPELPILQTISLGFRPSTTASSYSIGLTGSTLNGAPPSYGTRTIDGEAEPGWWAELYEGPQLVDAKRVGDDGTYSFEVPLKSSVTTRRLSLRGPHGEREWDQRTFAVGSDMLPPGDLRWNLGSSTYRYLDNQAVSASAGMTIGILDRLTLDVATRLPGTYVDRLSADSLRTSIGARLALFDATPLSVTLDPQTMRFGTSFSIEPVSGIPLRVRLDSVDFRQQTFDLSLSSRVALGPVNLSAIGRYVDRWDRQGYEISPKISARVLGVSLSASLRASRMEYFRGQTEIGDNNVDRRLLVNTQMSFSPIRRVRVRLGGSYDAVAREIAESSAGITFPVFNALSLGCSYAIRGTDWRHGSFSANVGLNLPFARGSVSSRYDDGNITTQSRLGGSLVFSPTGVDVVGGHATSRAQLFVYGYHDRNLNGEYDGDDVSLGPITAEALLKGGSRIATGSRFESLPARRSLVIEVDPEQFAAMGTYPLRTRHEFALASGTTRNLYVPFASGTELFGTARIDMPSGRAGQVAALLGLRIRLVSLSGVAEYEGEFINDGSYMMTGVAPGDYRFVIDDAAFSAAGLAIEDLPTSVTIEPGSETLPELIFVPIDNVSTPSDENIFED